MRDNTSIVAIPMQNLPRDRHRTYLTAVVPAGGPDLQVIISGGTPFTVLAGNSWGPQPAPMNDIEFNGVGTLLINRGATLLSGSLACEEAQ